MEQIFFDPASKLLFSKKTYLWLPKYEKQISCLSFSIRTIDNLPGRALSSYRYRENKKKFLILTCTENPEAVIDF